MPERGAPPAFELRGITKRFGDTLANDRVDLRVDVGEVHGLVGENGAGKTTLMRVLYGLHRPDAGAVQVAGRRRRFRSPLDAIAAGLGMVHQHFMLFDELTVAENIVFGAEPRKLGFVARKQAEQSVELLSRHHGLEVDPLARVGDLSVGVRQRVEILKALYRRAAVLILDEPTAVLTPAEQQALMDVLRRLAQGGTTVVLISHKLPEVLGICDRVTVMRAGRVVTTVDAAATSAGELARQMVGERVASPQAKAHELGESVLELVRLEVDRVDARSRVWVDDLEVRSGEIVGVAGVSGNGQRELAEAVAGVRATIRGSIRIGGRSLERASVASRRGAGLAWIPQDRDGAGLALTASVTENLLIGHEGEPALAPRGLLDREAIRGRARDLVRAYGVRGGIDDTAASLSGGNRQKLVVGRELSGGGRALVVEQPTRGVDLAARSLIHQEILDYSAAGGAVLLISTDLDELLELCDRTVVMLNGDIVGELRRDEATEERLGRLMTGAA